ncbi:hypothetical protein [Nonomuraea sp. NPDC049028]
MDAYGFDVIEWAGFHTPHRMGEVTMTTWLMQNVEESPDVPAALDRRAFR